jgi:phenylpropionate dioxygenase-like ring-hydroxylating dioxygenase large terminal subunit
LVRPDAVHRAAYVDADVFALEQERIFRRVWLYVAHESEIPEVGDYVLAPMGANEAIVVRQADGSIAALHNRCAHRGARVAVLPRGHVRMFTCAYHAWSFGLDGALGAIPQADGYPGKTPCGTDNNSLKRVPRVASYRGFIFASHASSGPDLPSYLGGLASALDNMVDRAPAGKIFRRGGSLRMEYRGNWKLFMENAVDLVHPGFVHGGSVAVARQSPETATAPGPAGQAAQMFLANGLRLTEWEQVSLRAFPQGHVYMNGFYRDGVIAAQRDDAVFNRYRAALVAGCGEEKTQQVLAIDRFNNLIWPTLSVNSRFQTMRLVQPVAVDRTVITSICFELGGAPPGMFDLALSFLNTASSAASMVASDDLEIFERCQRGMENSGDDWIDLSRGKHQDRVQEDGSILAPGTSELPIRAQLRAWSSYMAPESA